MSAPRPVPFAEGPQPAAQWFKSASLILEPQGDDFTVGAAALAEWITRHDAWFKAQIGVPEGRGLHHLYHRDVTVVGDAPLERWPRLATIGQACRAAGIGFTITVRAGRGQALERELTALLECGAVSSVGIFVFEDDEDVTPDALQGLLALLGRHGASLGLLGPVARFRALGVLASPQLNAQSFTLYPLAEASPHVSPWHEDVAPCFSRLRVHVDTDGALYPCLGLLGVECARLGSVFDPVEATVFGGQPSAVGWDDLARHGPALPAAASRARHSGLPVICERHRFALLEPHALP